MLSALTYPASGRGKFVVLAAWLLVVGVIINKPTNIPVRKLFPHAPAIKDQAGNAYFGGPVDLTEPFLVLRASQPPGKVIPLFDDIYLSTDPGSIAALLGDRGRVKDVRIVLGRAQWAHNQLRAEIVRGAWYVMPAKAELVFSPEPGRVWRTLVQHANLQEVDATRVEEPCGFGLLYCPGGLPGWRPYPAQAPSPAWPAFLGNHIEGIAAIDR